METSSALQHILREELQEATVVTIAHRVEAVRDAKYYIVLEAGGILREGKVEEGVIVGDEL
jgi:ABC-type multidrug transport system fused ATPase/permease subunit